MTEPFAKVRFNGIYWCAVMGDVSDWSEDPNVDDESDRRWSLECGFVKDRAEATAASLNAIFNTAARKYAADKIREAVKALCPSDIPGIGIGFLEARRQMLARADAVERGEA